MACAWTFKSGCHLNPKEWWVLTPVKRNHEFGTPTWRCWYMMFCGGGFTYCFMFIPILGKISNLTNIFQRGWHHQLVLCLKGFTRMVRMGVIFHLGCWHVWWQLFKCQSCDQRHQRNLGQSYILTAVLPTFVYGLFAYTYMKTLNNAVLLW